MLYGFRNGSMIRSLPFIGQGTLALLIDATIFCQLNLWHTTLTKKKKPLAHHLQRLTTLFLKNLKIFLKELSGLVPIIAN